jgi:anti-sigma factor ChrR (cupin superfamily)
MTRKTLEELAAGYALGALDSAEAAELEALIANDARVREEVSSFMEAAAALVAAACPSVPPTPELSARILAAVAATPQEKQAGRISSIPEGFSVVRNGESVWKESGIPGFRMKILSADPRTGTQIILAELAAGGRIPEHDHTGVEELYILTGHLHTEGCVLGPGDFLRAEAGTHHHELHSLDGCTALLINSPVPVS